MKAENTALDAQAVQAQHATRYYNQYGKSSSDFTSPTMRAASSTALSSDDTGAVAKGLGLIASAKIGHTPDDSDQTESASQKAHTAAALKYNSATREMALEVLPDSALEAKSGHYGATGQSTGGSATGHVVHAKNADDDSTKKA